MSIENLKQETMHRSAAFFEDAPWYDIEKLVKLDDLIWKLRGAKDDETKESVANEMNSIMDSLTRKEGSQDKIYLWPEGKMPSLGTYTDNSSMRYNHDPDFWPYLFEILVPEDVNPKGAVVVCAGADHGDCTLSEGYQSCLDLREQGYQCFLLLNRPNNCPYDGREAGADASRAIRYVRKNAAKYRIDENRVAFAGFSNGGLTAEACVQYYSGTQTIKTHFESYEPDELDEYYGAPDAILCVYGPRFKDAKFDYTNVVYPPIFFAVGRDDFAMNNLNYTWPDLLAHNVEVEVHTFSGVPHGQAGVKIFGNYKYKHFDLWVQLADVFMQNIYSKSVIKRRPDKLDNPEYRYDAFDNGNVLLNKKKGHLPPMGWNSWNAFGSGNTEALTKDMADAVVDLGLDKLGYKYLVLDDGCYKPVRVDGKLSNEEGKFPDDFKVLSDYIHAKGLKFGMYNDIGTNLCAGAAVGTCGHEMTDAKSYIDWGVDFLKVDNCYYLWDNATFSNAANARYVYAPRISGMTVKGKEPVYFEKKLSAVNDGILRGEGAEKYEGSGEKNDVKTGSKEADGTGKVSYVGNIGTFDGTGPDKSPVGMRSGELGFKIDAPEEGEYGITVNYATGTEPGVGSWLQIAVGEGEEAELFYDDFVPSSGNKDTFRESPLITVKLKKGENIIRLMNHRRQENTLSSYAALLEGLNKADPNHDIIFSICEWGKTQPQNWGYKVGDSWRILNDITFRVGSDGDPGHGSWTDGYTPSVTSQYNKAVIMDEFAGLDKGWNDPDMLMIGMDGLTENMQRTHMAMWCMMNAPLMLGLDLRRVQKGDALYKIIANERLIALNQDPLGIPAKRIYSSLAEKNPDKEYIRDNNRVDVLAKPLADGSVALSFINLSEEENKNSYEVDVRRITSYIGSKMINADAFEKASSFKVIDLWSGDEAVVNEGSFAISGMDACNNITIRVIPVI